MVSNSKDDHPSKATPIMNTGIATHPQAIAPIRRMVILSSKLQPPVWEKIKSVDGPYSDTV